MPYIPNEFQYSLLAFDAKDLSSETADIFSMKDSQIQDYLRTETSSIKLETDSLQTQVTSLQTQINERLLSSRFRFGSTVITTPAIGGSVQITFSPAFSSSSNLFVVITNGDGAASTAIFSAGIPSTSNFRVYRVSDGNTGDGARVNWIVYQL